MPFTPAHPAAVLPFLRVSAAAGAGSALVIGSMSPDFAYFVPWPPSRHQSHALPGLLTFCLPVSLVVLLLYETVLRRPLTFLLPGFIRGRLPREASAPELSLRALAAICVAILVGALTHQVWDSFTHANGVVVDWFPVTRTPLFTLGGFTVRPFKVFQHASTLLGFGLLALALRAWIRSHALGQVPDVTPSDRRFRRAGWIALVGVPLLAGLWAASFEPLPHYGWLRDLRLLTSPFVIVGGQAAAATALVYAGAWWLRRLPRRA